MARGRGRGRRRTPTRGRGQTPGPARNRAVTPPPTDELVREVRKGKMSRFKIRKYHPSLPRDD